MICVLYRAVGRATQVPRALRHLVSPRVLTRHTYNALIIYRDVKPSNIIRCLGKYLLSDFGIAKTINNSYTLVGKNSYRALAL